MPMPNQTLLHPNGTVFEFELTPSCDYRVTRTEPNSATSSIHFLTLESATELIFGLMRANSKNLRPELRAQLGRNCLIID